MQPILFEFKGITIYSLWVFASLGFFIGTLIFGKLAQKNRLRLQLVLDLSSKILIGAIIGGRIFHVLGNLQFYFSGFQFRRMLGIFAIWDSEISFWGALLGGVYIFIKNLSNKEESLGKWGDIFVIATLAAMSIGNIGTFLGGNNYGNETSLPIGITFDSAFVKYTVPIHPVQLYAATYTALLALWLYSIHRKYKNQYEGLVFLLGLTCFSSLRFLEGFLRGDDVISLWFIRIPQWTFFIIAIIGTRKLYKYQKKNRVPFLKSFEKSYKKVASIKQR